MTTTMTIRVPAGPGEVYAQGAFDQNVGKPIEILRGALDGEHPDSRVMGILTDVKVTEHGQVAELTIAYPAPRPLID